jgi:hypothetical protein
MAWHAATSRVENSAQGSSCQLKFLHVLTVESDRTDIIEAVEAEEGKLDSAESVDNFIKLYRLSINKLECL